MAIKDMSLFEQRYAVRLRVHNPNPFDLPLTGVNFQAELNGMPLGEGLGNTAVTVPALGSALLEAEAYCSVTDMYRQVMSWRAGPPQTVRYWIGGKLHARDGRSIAFESRSEFKLPAE
jgi:LEA14-like dessication related protein